MKNLDNLKNIIDSNLKELDMSPDSKDRLRKSVKGKNIGFKFGVLKYIAPSAVAAVVALIMIFNNFFGAATTKVYAKNLMEGISPQRVNSIELSDDFIKSTADFSVDLFKETLSKGENTLVSPTSVYLALGMTANGADGNTLKEFEKVLGRHGLDISELNRYYYSLAEELANTKTEKINITNSIWYRDNGLNINKDFLQTNANYYGASAYMADFNSDKTVDDINNWVKQNTKKRIDKIIEGGINPNTVMFLINTLYFEGEWAEVYKKSDIIEGSFKFDNANTVPVEFMNSVEEIYLKDSKAQGFIKPYKGGQYSFIALLPNEGISLESYVSSLKGEDFLKLIENRENEGVLVSLPKFKAEYSKELKEPLTKMGLEDCFGNADFSRMQDPKVNEGLYISSVLHKTFIQVDEQGTKAGAATKVEVQEKGMKVSTKKIVLDRPFLYAIIDNQTNLPIFLGVMNNPSK